MFIVRRAKKKWVESNTDQVLVLNEWNDDIDDVIFKPNINGLNILIILC